MEPVKSYFLFHSNYYLQLVKSLLRKKSVATKFLFPGLLSENAIQGIKNLLFLCGLNSKAQQEFKHRNCDGKFLQNILQEFLNPTKFYIIFTLRPERWVLCVYIYIYILLIYLPI